MTSLIFSRMPIGHDAGSPFKAAMQFVARKVEELKAHHQRELEIRKAVEELRTYSDRELSDFGLSRDQIENAVRAGF